jgi:hypothetical protein
MADSIVAQHNLTRNALPSSRAASRLSNYATPVLVSLLALGAFVLTYASLWKIALTFDLSPYFAWIWPLLVHFILIVFSLIVVHVNLRNERAFWPWLLATIYSITSVTSTLFSPPILRSNFVEQTITCNPEIHFV